MPSVEADIINKTCDCNAMEQIANARVPRRTAFDGQPVAADAVSTYRAAIAHPACNSHAVTPAPCAWDASNELSRMARAPDGYSASVLLSWDRFSIASNFDTGTDVAAAQPARQWLSRGNSLAYQPVHGSRRGLLLHRDASSGLSITEVKKSRGPDNEDDHDDDNGFQHARQPRKWHPVTASRLARQVLLVSPLDRSSPAADNDQPCACAGATGTHTPVQNTCGNACHTNHIVGDCGSLHGLRALYVTRGGRLWTYPRSSGHWASPAGRATESGDGDNNLLLSIDSVTGETRPFLRGAISNEVTGVCATPDERSLFVDIRCAADALIGRVKTIENNPHGNWVASTLDNPFCSICIVVTRNDGGPVEASSSPGVQCPC